MTERFSPVIADLVKGRKRNGRCVYDRAAKRALVEAAELPGVSVARLALDHAVNANLLRKWVCVNKMPDTGEEKSYSSVICATAKVACLALNLWTVMPSGKLMRLALL